MLEQEFDIPANLIGISHIKIRMMLLKGIQLIYPGIPRAAADNLVEIFAPTSAEDDEEMRNASPSSNPNQETSSFSRPALPLPIPMGFSGTGSDPSSDHGVTSYHLFKDQVYAQLMLNRHLFADEDEKVAYIRSLLHGKAASTVALLEMSADLVGFRCDANEQYGPIFPAFKHWGQILMLLDILWEDSPDFVRGVERREFVEILLPQRAEGLALALRQQRISVRN